MAPAEDAAPSAAPLPADGLTCGHSVRERFAFLAAQEDRLPDGATEEELAQVEELRRALLEAEGRTSLPEDWIRTYYYRCTLLRYLRAKGSQEVALTALQKSIQWAGSTYTEMLRKHEQEDHPLHKALARRYTPDGPFGVDRRGVPVSYVRFGLRDTAGIMRETGPEVFQRFYVDKICRDTISHIIANSKIEGHTTMHLDSIFVVDMASLTWTKGAAQVEFLMWLADNILTEHFPEVTRISFVLNAPWFFSMGWTLMQPFIPARTKAKFRIFSAGEPFLDDLQEHIALEQIPDFLGGTSPEPWPHGEGGDVPNGIGRLEAGAHLDGHRQRKPSWMRVAMASAAGSSSHRRRHPAGEARDAGGASLGAPDGADGFNPDDRSLGLAGPFAGSSSSSSSSPSSSSSSQPWYRKRPWGRGDPKVACQAEGPDAAAAHAGRGAAHAGEGASVVEMAPLAFVAFSLHGALRCSEVLSAHASLTALLGVCTALQLLRHRRRHRPAAAGVAKTAAEGVASQAGGSAPRDRQLPIPASERPTSWQSASSASSESSWSSLFFAPPDDGKASPDGAAAPAASEAVAGQESSWSTWAPAIVDVFGQLGEVPGGLAQAWPACVESWADRQSRCLRLCRRAPESGWKTDLPYRRPSTVEEEPEE